MGFGQYEVPVARMDLSFDKMHHNMILLDKKGLSVDQIRSTITDEEN